MAAHHRALGGQLSCTWMTCEASKANLISARKLPTTQDKFFTNQPEPTPLDPTRPF